MTKKKQSLLTKVDYTIDRVTFDDKNIEEVNTYYNDIQNLLTSENYLNCASNEEILIPRRRSLEVLFYNRVEFILRRRIELMDSYLSKYGLFLSYTVVKTIKEQLPELFDITFYFSYMNNPITASDYALALNSIIYNYTFNTIEYEHIDDPQQAREKVELLNNFMKMSLNEFVLILNGLYLEANEVYYNAGIPAPEVDHGIEFLTGKEREQVLIELGRPDLIDTDIKVGRS